MPRGRSKISPPRSWTCTRPPRQERSPTALPGTLPDAELFSPPSPSNPLTLSARPPITPLTDPIIPLITSITPLKICFTPSQPADQSPVNGPETKVAIPFMISIISVTIVVTPESNPASTESAVPHAPAITEPNTSINTGATSCTLLMSG